MPPRKLVIAFACFWLTLGVVVFFESLHTFLHAVIARAGHAPHIPLALLAGVETVSAVLFLFPRTMRIGAIGMVATFVVALVIHGAMGQLNEALVVYLAGTVFVLVHGPVSVRAHAPAVA